MSAAHKWAAELFGSAGAINISCLTALDSSLITLCRSRQAGDSQFGES